MTGMFYGLENKENRVRINQMINNTVDVSNGHGKLAFLRFLQTIFSIILCLIAFIWIRTPHIYSISYAIITGLYFLATIGIFFDLKLAWIYSIFPPLLVFTYFGIEVFYNFVMFLIRDDLYVDSPGTIFVVIIYGIFTVLPSGVILLLFWLNRKYLLEIFRKQ